MKWAENMLRLVSCSAFMVCDLWSVLVAVVRRSQSLSS